MKLVTMYLLVSVLIASSVLADESQERRSKLPYIADALGNKIPPPSIVPATVGSPVNLLTPDRYEFYTFDGSGELVKRLMTLEEIQAIVAAGEDTDGLVTFANDDQPTIAFNFSQPPYTKVHSVVTNVQNVLKAQMEAHKNNPNMQPTFDTPDVSDSWSLILPSIFGNTGVDIVPDKTSGAFITPETETIDVDNANDDYLYSLSKEASSKPQYSPSTEPTYEAKRTSIRFESSTTTPVTVKLTSTQNTKPVTQVSSSYPKDTTEKFKLTSTTHKPSKVTTKPLTNAPNSSKYSTKANIKTKPTSINAATSANSKETDNKSTIKMETSTHKIKGTTENVFIPVSTVSYITERTTNKPIKVSTNTPSTYTDNALINRISEIMSSSTIKPQSTTKESASSPIKHNDFDNTNSTTITTQSVSPSTTMSTTELISSQHVSHTTVIADKENINNKLDGPLPLFDVAQSISQIASDLGGNYETLPTTSNMLETTKSNENFDKESKENIDIDIPQEPEKDDNKNVDSHVGFDNFVKISMVEPNNQSKEITQDTEDSSTEANDEEMTTLLNTLPEDFTTLNDIVETTTIDRILSESMGDLLSQVVYQNNDVKIAGERNSLNDSYVSDQVITTTLNEDSEPATTTETSTNTVIISTTNKSILRRNENEDNATDNVTFPLEKRNLTSNKQNNYDNPILVSISSSDNKINTLSPDRTKASDDKKVDTVDEKISISTLQNLQESDKLQQKINVDPNVSVKTHENKGSNIIKSSSKNVSNATSVNKNVPSNDNKVSLTEENKSDSKINKGSNLPKVDEFKKKIQKINIDDKELANERNNSWKLIPTVPPPKTHNEIGNKYKPEGFYTPENNADKDIVLDFSKENQGLEVTTKDLGEDISQFVELCNELAFQFWKDLSAHVDKKRSFVFSPYAITSMLAMMFMGARGATSGEMNEILKLDDMVTFNPHFTLKNISDSIDISPTAGVAASAFIRELFSDRSKGKILTFYKERAQQFYNGHVEEVNFKLISDIIRRRTNLLVKRYTYGKITEYMKSNSIVMQPPLAAFSTNIFETDCSGSSVDGRDGEMYFVVSPNVRQRRLVPVPAVVYRSNFLAGYDPVLDATAAALGNTNAVISTLFLMPGQQGNIVHADDLEVLEKRLLDSHPNTPAWNRLLRTLLPRVGLELQIPRFSHKSIFNISSSLRNMGLKDIFDPDHADLGGVNGPSKNLYLSDMVQLNTFVTCGESVVGEQHHIEEYPETLALMEKVQKRRSSRWLNWDEPRDYQRAFHDPHDVGEAMHLPLHLRPRQARLPARNAQPARLKFDRPFLYFVRHNPSGMILYVGRYNPRLLP